MSIVVSYLAISSHILTNSWDDGQCYDWNITSSHNSSHNSSHTSDQTGPDQTGPNEGRTNLRFIQE